MSWVNSYRIEHTAYTTDDHGLIHVE